MVKLQGFLKSGMINHLIWVKFEHVNPTQWMSSLSVSLCEFDGRYIMEQKFTKFGKSVKYEWWKLHTLSSPKNFMNGPLPIKEAISSWGSLFPWSS